MEIGSPNKLPGKSILKISNNDSLNRSHSGSLEQHPDNAERPSFAIHKTVAEHIAEQRIADAGHHPTGIVDNAVDVKGWTAEAEEGKLYMGTVKKVMEFGAFVEIFPGTDGLVHVSELDTERVKNVTDVLNEGDKVLVKCIGIDKQGKIKLSRKEALGATFTE